VPKNSIDIKLIQETLSGSTAAFENLYRRYSKHHLLICIRYMKSRFDAEDMLQEAYIKIYKDLKKFDSSRGTFNTWSSRIIINTFLHQLRKFRSKFDIVDIHEMNTDISVSPDAMQNMNLKDLTKVISTLSDGYRTVFNMYVIDGYSHKEIADTLDISVSTSKSQLMRAKQNLKKKFSNNEYASVGIYA